MGQITKSFEIMVENISQLKDPALTQKYQSDASGYNGKPPALVLRPRNTHEVALIMKACAQFKKKVVVQGGLTGLAGGASAQNNEVVINLEQMNQIEMIDTIGGTALVQAGVILETLQQAVEEKDWYFPLDLGARGSCTIGGNISTNAGGNRVLRYGTTRELVLGLEVVLPTGEILEMNKSLLKNNTGLDLKHLFIGTEGRYGIVTKAVLRLFPKPQKRLSALVAVQTFAQVTKLLRNARQMLPELSSFEVMWKSYVAVAAKVKAYDLPFNGAYEFNILIEVEGQDNDLFQEQFEAFLEQQLEQEIAQDAIIPQTVEQTNKLWEIRDAIGDILQQYAPLIAFDISVPLSQMDSFITEVTTQLEDQYPYALNLIFGHLGDGNLHLTPTKLKEEDIDPIEILVYEIVQRYNGSITAEHGIGCIKKPFLHYSRSEAEIKLMEQIRILINSDNLLNFERVIN